MRPLDITTVINNRRFFTVTRFAWATKRSVQNVRFLMSYGNKVRKLLVEYVGGKPFIPYEELFNFPFTVPGRNSSTIYHYKEDDGQPLECKECELEWSKGIRHDGERSIVHGGGDGAGGVAPCEADVRA